MICLFLVPTLCVGMHMGVRRNTPFYDRGCVGLRDARVLSWSGCVVPVRR